MDWCSAVALHDVDVAVPGGTVRLHLGGNGPPLVLVHGNPTHGYLWRHVVPDLMGRFECHVVDLPGFGASAADSPLLLDGHAAAVAEVVQRHLPTADQVWWLVHDWGCAVALQATRLLPRRRHAVALTEGHLRWLPGWDQLDPGFCALFRPLREERAGHDHVVVRNAFIDRVLLGSLPHLSDGERDAYRQPFAEPARRQAILALARQVPVSADTPSMDGVLEAVATVLSDPEVPTLLLEAAPGAVVDAAGAAWVRAHASSLSTADVGPAGHFTPEEQPAAIAAAFLEWSQALEGAPDHGSGGLRS